MLYEVIVETFMPKKGSRALMYGLTHLSLLDTAYLPFPWPTSRKVGPTHPLRMQHLFDCGWGNVQVVDRPSVVLLRTEDEQVNGTIPLYLSAIFLF